MTDTLAIIRGLPRIRLAHLPTPMEPMPRLASALGLSSLWVKRDDCTGLGVGGNKIRKLEFDLAAALAEGADCVVCGGVVQSNTARQAAAACAKLGLECHLGIMHGRLARTEPGYDDTGNALLNRLFGRSSTTFRGMKIRTGACADRWRLKGRTAPLPPRRAGRAPCGPRRDRPRSPKRCVDCPCKRQRRNTGRAARRVVGPWAFRPRHRCGRRRSAGTCQSRCLPSWTRGRSAAWHRAPLAGRACRDRGRVECTSLRCSR